MKQAFLGRIWVLGYGFFCLEGAGRTSRGGAKHRSIGPRQHEKKIKDLWQGSSLASAPAPPEELCQTFSWKGRFSVKNRGASQEEPCQTGPKNSQRNCWSRAQLIFEPCINA